MSKKTDVIEKPNGALALNNGPKQGLEGAMDQGDFEIPRAKLLQSNSPEVADIDGLKAGMIINSLTNEVLPAEFVPVFRFKNWLRFNPREAGKPGFDPKFAPGALIWRSDDPNDPKVIDEGKWGADGSKPLATAFLNFFAYFPGVPMPVVIGFCNTSYKAGKKLNTLAQFSPGNAIWTRAYKLNPFKDTNDKGTFYVHQVAFSREARDEEKQIGKMWYEQFGARAAELNVHDEAEAQWDE